MKEHNMQPIHKKISRNDKCPCRSGKKAKRCCLPKLRVLAELPPNKQQQAIITAILNPEPIIIGSNR